MELLLIFSVVGLILAIGFLSEILFRKTGIPDVLILIGFGLFLRYGIKIVQPENFGEGAAIFTTFALLFILFQGSLSINFRTLVQSASSALKLTILTFVASVALVTGIIMLLTVFDVLQFTFLSALLLGTILGGTSSMVVVPMLQNMGMNGKSKSVLVLESAISDVLCILASLTIVEAITTGSIIASEVSRSLLASFGLSLLVGAVVGTIWVFTLEKFTSLARAYVVNIGLVLMLYSAVESSFVAASGPIACLTFGLMLRNSKSILLLGKKKDDDDEIKPILTAEAKNFYAEISFLLKATFFVYLGILINVSNYLALSLGLLFTAVIYFARPLIVRTIFKKNSSIDTQERVLLEVMIPKGLAASVLAQFAATKLAPIEGYAQIASILTDISFATILFSILLTSILVFTSKKNWFKGFYPKRFLGGHTTTISTQTNHKNGVNHK